MARLPRICPVGIPQHVIQRGNNHQLCFAAEKNYIAYTHWLTEASMETKVSVHAWVFMTNHVHILATPETEDGISKMMQIVGRRYVRYFNYMYGRTGTLWEGRFKSCVVDADHYLLACQRYIELNPVRAGMAASPADYKWSSYHANALAKPSQLWTPHALWESLGRSNSECAEQYRQLFNGYIDDREIRLIRDSVNKGLALGSDRFRNEIEQLTGRRVTPLKRGRPVKLGSE